MSPRRASRAARFAGTVLTALAALVLFDRLIYAAIVRAEGRIYRDDAFAEAFDAYAAGRRFDILVLGTSRTYEGIHPAVLEAKTGHAAYREAFIGRCPKYSYYFYRFFKRRAGVPRVVIYGVDYFVFNQVSHRRWLGRFGRAAEPPSPWSAPSLLLRNKTETENVVADLLARNDPDRTGLGPDPLENIERAQAHVGIDPRPGAVVAARPASFKRVPYPRYPGKEGAYLKRLVDEAAADGAAVVLVVLPDHVGTLRTNVGWYRFVQELQALVADVPRAQVLNYGRYGTFPQGRADFFIDGGWGMTNSHLSRAGSDLFSRMVAEKIAPLLEETP